MPKESSEKLLPVLSNILNLLKKIGEAEQPPQTQTIEKLSRFINKFEKYTKEQPKGPYLIDHYVLFADTTNLITKLRDSDALYDLIVNGELGRQFNKLVTIFSQAVYQHKIFKKETTALQPIISLESLEPVETVIAKGKDEFLSTLEMCRDVMQKATRIATEASESAEEKTAAVEKLLDDLKQTKFKLPEEKEPISQEMAKDALAATLEMFAINAAALLANDLAITVRMYFQELNNHLLKT